MVHINCLKAYKERAEVLRLDLVLEGERNVLKGGCSLTYQGIQRGLR